MYSCSSPLHGTDILGLTRTVNGASTSDYEKSSSKSSEFSLGGSLERARNHQFVGRQKTLSLLHEMLTGSTNRKGPNIVVLYGIGGVGKTEIAVEYAYRSRKTYQSVFWVDGSSKQVFVNSVHHCLEVIKSTTRTMTSPIWYIVESPTV